MDAGNLWSAAQTRSGGLRLLTFRTRLRTGTTADRELKQLQRRHLATFGLSKDACNPRVRESFAELVGQSLLANGLPLLQRILDRGSPLIDAGLLDPDGLNAALAELEDGPYSEDPWSKLVEVITLDQAARAFLP